jgi:hypothetical protein
MLQKYKINQTLHRYSSVSAIVSLLGVFFIIGITLLLPAKVADATSASSTINFQSRLLTSSGAVVPDGNYNVEFKIYNSASSSGSSQGSCSGDSSCLWVETRTGANTVSVLGGYMSVQLGNVNAFPSVMNWGQPLWLSVRIGGIGGSPSWDLEMNPRLPLTAVPYAFSSQSLVYNSGSYSSSLVFNPQSGNNTYDLPDIGGATANVCLSTGNCVGNGSSGSSIGGSGSANTIALFTGSGYTIGNSLLTQSGSTIATAGVLQAGTSVLTTLLDTPSSGGTLAVGTTNATGGIDLNQSTTLASNDNLAYVSGTGSFDQSASSGNFATGSGYVHLNGNTTIASGKTLQVNGTTTINTGSTTALQVQNSSNASLLTADTTNMRLGVDVAYAAMSSPSISNITTSTTGGNLTANTYYYEVTAVDAAGGETSPSTQASQTTTGSTSTVTITWAPIAGAAAYNIYRSTTSGTFTTGDDSTIGTVSGSNLTFIDTNITLNNATASAPSTNTAYYASSNNSNGDLQLSVGGNGTPTGQLYVGGNVPANYSGITSAGLNAPQSVSVSGSYAYVTNPGNNTLEIFDISNPANPVEIGSTNSGLSSPYFAAVSGHYAYVASYNNSSIVIFDISNPPNPVEVGSTTNGLSYPNFVAVSGQYAYVTNSSTTIGLTIFDISNPANPVEVGSAITGLHSPTSVAISGRYAYVTGNGNYPYSLYIKPSSLPL